MPPKKKRKGPTPQKPGIARQYLLDTFSGFSVVPGDGLLNGHVLYFYSGNNKSETETERAIKTKFTEEQLISIPPLQNRIRKLANKTLDKFGTTPAQVNKFKDICSVPFSLEHIKTTCGDASTSFIISSLHFKDASGPTSEHPDPVPVQLGKVINNERQRGKRVISLHENLCDPGSVNVHNQQNMMPSESAVILQCAPGVTFQSNIMQTTNNTKFSSLDVLATAAQIQEERSTQLGEKQQPATKKPPEDLNHPPSTVADLDCHYFEVDSVRTSSIKNLFEHYTGLTYAMFTALFEFLVPDPTRNPVKCCSNRCYIYTLPLKQQLFMVLCRLRNGLHAKDLAFRMRVSPQTVVTVFNSWIKVMHVRLSCLPWWQHRDTLLGVQTATHQQECGGNYLGIVGQAELRMEESSTLSHCYCDDDIAIKTLKSLIVINSRGSLMFVSELFSGSMPDSKVCEDSDLMKLLSEHKATGMIQDGDGIVAEERFQIKSQLDKLGLEVITPQDTMSINSGKVTKTTEVAAHRVQMKLAIDRIKGFKLVSRTIPFNLVQQINDVWYVCSMLTNFQVARTQEL